MIKTNKMDSAGRNNLSGGMDSPCLGSFPARRRGLGRNAGGFRIRQIIFSPTNIHIWNYNSILSINAIVDNITSTYMAQISKKLGDNIKQIRLRRKMSQGDICRAIEMDRSYMSAIESGKKNVTIAIVEKIARALNVSVDELLK